MESLQVTDDAQLPTLLDVNDCAAALGVCTKTVRRLIGAGKLPAVKVGRCLRVRASDLRVFIEQLLPASTGRVRNRAQDDQRF